MKSKKLFSAMALILALLMMLSACVTVTGGTPTVTPDETLQATTTPETTATPTPTPTPSESVLLDEEWDVLANEYIKSYVPTGRDWREEYKELKNNGIYYDDTPPESLDKDTINLYEDFLIYHYYAIFFSASSDVREYAHIKKHTQPSVNWNQGMIPLNFCCKGMYTVISNIATQRNISILTTMAYLKP